MDPLSITAATIGLATFCGQAINILLKFAGNNTNIEFTIKTFADEVSNLDRVLKSITASSKDRSIISLAAGTGHEAQHWRDVLTSLGECRSCITRLVAILEKLEGDTGNVFKRTRRQLRLSIESGEIAVLRRQILSFTQTMQISLQMLLLSSHLAASDETPQAVLPRLDDINSNLHEVLKLVRAQLQQGTPTVDPSTRIVQFTNHEATQLGPTSSITMTKIGESAAIEPKVDNLPLRPKGDVEMTDPSSTTEPEEIDNSNSLSSTDPCPLEIQSETLESHLSVMKNMQTCLQSAGSLISSMSTTLSMETEQFPASDFDCSITGDQREGIEDWVTSAECNSSNNDKMEEKESCAPIVLKSIEHEILDKFYTLGKQHFEAAEYSNAERFLFRFLDADSAGREGDDCRLGEAQEMLATSLVKQKKLIDAEKVLLSFISSSPRQDLRVIRSTYSLAEIYLETGQSDKAEIYCKQTLKEADQVFGRTHPLVHRSSELLMEIYRNTGDLVSLEACGLTLCPGRIVPGGFRWNKAVSLLKDNGFSLEGMDQERKSNALRWATEKGFENVVLVLLETKDGIKDIVNQKDRIGKTALHYGAAYGHSSIANILLENHADVEIRAACSMKALHLAAHYGEVEVVRVLLDYGADIESKTSDGKTVLHHAVERNSLAIIQLMMTRQANIEARDLKQRTPMFWGCQHDRMDAIKLLLLHGANVMAKDVEGNTPLHWAAWYGRVPMIKLFVEHGADLSAKGVNDENPLGLAVSNGHAKAVLTLLDYGAQTELKNRFGRTPLHFAAKKGNLDIVSLLVKCGANVLARDEMGKTVLDVARDNRQQAVSSYLSRASQQTW